MEAEPPKRKRRWFQYSLRSLFVVVTAAGLLCPIGVRIVREWQERQPNHNSMSGRKIIIIDPSESMGLSSK